MQSLKRDYMEIYINMIISVLLNRILELLRKAGGNDY